MSEEYHFSIDLPLDDEGYYGRECPNVECGLYFKAKPGTGLSGPDLLTKCPYCGYASVPDEFLTKAQKEYMGSIVIQGTTKSLKSTFRMYERAVDKENGRKYENAIIIPPNIDYPISYYSELDLETKIICSNCQLEYAIYGIFAYCPDCGTHNSLAILLKNFELIDKKIKFAENLCDTDLAQDLIEDTLENVVSTFDGFGRAVYKAFAHLADQGIPPNNSFQNLPIARKNFQTTFGYDISMNIAPQEWNTLIIGFQKRHLLSHKLGVIDQEYIDKSKDPSAVIGRKITVSKEEVHEVIRILEIISKGITGYFVNHEK